MPSATDLQAVYQDYDVLGEESPYFNGLAHDNARATVEGKTTAKTVDWMLIHAPAPCRVLDVGSGTGFLPQLLKERGLAADGVELNERAANWSASRTGLTAYSGTIVDVPDHEYDVVTLWDVLEHVNDPAGLFYRARELLAAGGCVFIETPNEGALLDRCVLLLDRAGLHWPASACYGIHHVVLFRPAIGQSPPQQPWLHCS